MFKEIPGPTPWPLIGNIPNLVYAGDDVLKFLLSWAKQVTNWSVI